MAAWATGVWAADAWAGTAWATTTTTSSAEPIEGSGGGYHFHPRQKALDWRVRDKNEIARILRELGENPETAERVAEIKAEHAKPLTKAEAKKPPEKRKPPQFDIARLMADMADTAWLIQQYDALVKRQLLDAMRRQQQNDDYTAILLLM